MRLKVVLIFSHILVILIGSVIEARWSKTLPRSENKKIAKIGEEVKSQAFQTLPKKFQNKSEKEIMEKYCRFLLGADKECLAKYVDVKLRKFQENKEKQTRWSGFLPRSENKKMPKIKTPTNVKSQFFSNQPKNFQDKSDREKMDKYCRFLLGAYKECMAKYVDLKLGKVHENQENPYKQKKPSTTSSPPIDRHEKIYVRI